MEVALEVRNTWPCVSSDSVARGAELGPFSTDGDAHAGRGWGGAGSLLTTCPSLPCPVQTLVTPSRARMVARVSQRDWTDTTASACWAMEETSTVVGVNLRSTSFLSAKSCL